MVFKTFLSYSCPHSLQSEEFFTIFSDFILSVQYSVWKFKELNNYLLN